MRHIDAAEAPRAETRQQHLRDQQQQPSGRTSNSARRFQRFAPPHSTAPRWPAGRPSASSRRSRWTDARRGVPRSPLSRRARLAIALRVPMGALVQVNPSRIRAHLEFVCGRIVNHQASGRRRDGVTLRAGHARREESLGRAGHGQRSLSVTELAPSAVVLNTKRPGMSSVPGVPSTCAVIRAASTNLAPSSP